MLHKASRYEAYVIIGRKSANRTSGCRGLAEVLACGASLAVGKRRWCSGVASLVHMVQERRLRRQDDARDARNAHDDDAWHCQEVILYEPEMSIYSPDRWNFE